MTLLAKSADKRQDSFFSYGGVLASTMTQLCHYGQDIGSWVEELCGYLEAMVDHGMTSASIMICWDMVEFIQDKYDFEHYDPLVEKAEKLGLKLALWLWEEITPDWVAEKHPDWLYEADDGTMPPDCSIYHPGFRQKIRDFLEHCVLRYKNSKALYMWNIAPEPFYSVPYRGRVLSEKNYEKIYCYNPATIAEFRKWLNERYCGDIVKLNINWMSNYKHFDEVEPPRFNPNAFHSCRVIDWRLFWIDGLSKHLSEKVEFVKSIDSEHPITGHTGNGWNLNSAINGRDFHRYVKSFDAFGISRFPIYEFGRQSRLLSNIAYTYIGSACYPDKETQVILQGGPSVRGGFDIHECPSPEEIEQWAWQAVGAGVKAIWHWSWHPHKGGSELGGYGLVGMDGKPTGRSIAASKTCKTLQRIAPVLKELKPVRPKVALILSQTNNVLCQTTNLNSGNLQLRKRHTDCLQGYFNILEMLRIPVHIVAEEQLKELVDGNLSHIEAVIIPFMPAISDEQIKIIAELGKCKKIIWSDPWLASRTMANSARDFTPDRKLAEVFGCQQKIVRPIVADTQFNRQNSWRNKAIIDKGCCRTTVDGIKFCFESNCYEIELEAEGSAVIAGIFGNGAAGVICNRVEDSELFYSGSFFSLPYADPNSTVFVSFKSGGECEGLIGYFASLLSKARIVAPVEPTYVCDSDIESKILLGQNKIFLVLINHGPKKSKGKWRIRTEFDVSDASLLFDVLTEQRLEFNIAACRLVEVDIEIERSGVKVLLLSGK